MSAADDPEAWLAKVRSDLRTMEILEASGEQQLNEAICFHAQQAAEKVLKALLVCHRVRFPKMHDVGALLQLCTTVAPELSDLRQECELLTEFAVESRYPDDLPISATQEDVRRAVAAARHVCDRVIPLVRGAAPS